MVCWLDAWLKWSYIVNLFVMLVAKLSRSSKWNKYDFIWFYWNSTRCYSKHLIDCVFSCVEKTFPSLNHSIAQNCAFYFQIAKWFPSIFLLAFLHFERNFWNSGSNHRFFQLNQTNCPAFAEQSFLSTKSTIETWW